MIRSWKLHRILLCQMRMRTSKQELPSISSSRTLAYSINQIHPDHCITSLKTLWLIISGKGGWHGKKLCTAIIISSWYFTLTKGYMLHDEEVAVCISQGILNYKATWINLGDFGKLYTTYLCFSILAEVHPIYPPALCQPSYELHLGNTLVPVGIPLSFIAILNWLLLRARDIGCSFASLPGIWQSIFVHPALLYLVMFETHVGAFKLHKFLHVCVQFQNCNVIDNESKCVLLRLCERVCYVSKFHWIFVSDWYTCLKYCKINCYEMQQLHLRIYV